MDATSAMLGCARTAQGLTVGEKKNHPNLLAGDEKPKANSRLAMASQRRQLVAV
jgi:hypothetical protein